MFCNSSLPSKTFGPTTKSPAMILTRTHTFKQKTKNNRSACHIFEYAKHNCNLHKLLEAVIWGSLTCPMQYRNSFINWTTLCQEGSIAIEIFSVLQPLINRKKQLYKIITDQLQTWTCVFFVHISSVLFILNCHLLSPSRV